MAILTNSFFLKFTKLAIVTSALYYILIKVEETELTLFHLTISNISILVVFTVFNWCFEILKWKALANHLQKTSFYEALKQSLSSHTTAIITPNRIGEYGAKAIYFKEKKKALGLNFISNSYQLLMTVFFGSIGLTILSTRYPKVLLNHNTIYFMLTFVCMLVFGIYFIRKKLDKYISFYRNIANKTHFRTLIFSLLKYIVFSHQFIYLLLIFEVDIDYTSAMPLLFSMYFLASVVPNFAILDFIIKGSAAILVFSLESVSATSITSIVGISWILNFAIPAIIGSAFVLRYKPKLSYDSI